MENPNEMVTLEVQGMFIKCERQMLLDNSDYFKAMFAGNFMERNMNKVSLNDVEGVAISLIIQMLWNEDMLLEEKDILSVLQAACMLQFLQIKYRCVKQLEEQLSVENCLKIWLYTELLGIKEIYCKAKLLALMEFMQVRNTDSFLELHLSQVIIYLGSVNLQPKHEIYVFQSLIAWYENYNLDNLMVLEKLLFCLNFNVLSDVRIHEIISNPTFSKYLSLVSHLKCLIAIRRNDKIGCYPIESIGIAHLLLKSKERNLQGSPCILVVDDLILHDIETAIQDKYKRKLKYTTLTKDDRHSFKVLHIDLKKNTLNKLFNLQNSGKYDVLDGFKIMGYKHFAILFGGENILGKGVWNFDCHIYDLIRDKWTTKKLPYSRRHFDSTVCGKYLFVVGGTGAYRVIQDNMFWYDFELDKWSPEILLPCSGKQIKCCLFKGRFFLLDINNRHGYVYCLSSNKWTQLEIQDENNILPTYSNKLTVFEYKGNLYVKEDKLFLLHLTPTNKLTIVGKVPLPDGLQKKHVYHVESVFSRNALYSLNKTLTQGILSLEKIIFDKFLQCQRINDEILHYDNETDEPRCSFIFNVFYPSFVEGNDLVGIVNP